MRHRRRSHDADQSSGTIWRRAAVAAVAWGAELILRAWHASWRKDMQQVGRLDELLHGPSPVLVAFWHGKYLPLFALLEGRRATVIAGDSFRGDVIARLSRRFGHEVVLIPTGPESGSSTDLEAILGPAHTVAVAVDGPLGPYQMVKPGLLRLASDLGFVILPVSVAAAQKSVQKARWDRREWPWPFARIALSVGEPMSVSPAATRDDLARCAVRLREALLDADREAERRACDPSY